MNQQYTFCMHLPRNMVIWLKTAKYRILLLEIYYLYIIPSYPNGLKALTMDRLKIINEVAFCIMKILYLLLSCLVRVREILRSMELIPQGL